MIHPENVDYTDIYIPIFGLLGIIIGAIITGIIQIFRDRTKLKNEKLSTAYAFKGEIQSLLEIVETMELKKNLNEFINYKNKFLELYNEQLAITNNNILKSLHHLAGLHEVSYFYPFYFTVSQDLFLVKYTFKDKIGLLDNSLENIIKFYQYVNILLLDIEYNKTKKEELDELRVKARSAANPHEVIINYYDTHNIIGEVKNDIEYHKYILKILNKIVEYGKNCIIDLDKFINANLSCKQKHPIKACDQLEQ